jgi:hypothetical protein
MRERRPGFRNFLFARVFLSSSSATNALTAFPPSVVTQSRRTGFGSPAPQCGASGIRSFRAAPLPSIFPTTSLGVRCNNGVLYEKSCFACSCLVTSAGVGGLGIPRAVDPLYPTLTMSGDLSCWVGKYEGRYWHGGRYWGHRYSYRPYGWQTLGCVAVGPVWYCP